MKLVLALSTAMLAGTPSAIGGDVSLLGIGFICGAETAPTPTGGAASGVMLPGFGAATFAVDTESREAAAWFNHGLRLYHAFAHDEAKAAFARAAAADPSCSLCASGVALSLGPTLNTGITPLETIEALKMAKRAGELAKPGDVRAKGLAEALQLRYGPETPPQGREQAFGQALDALFRAAPGDDMLANLTAHVLIIPARQDDYSGLPRAIEILETVLARSPDDSAAIHYYIHATEFAGKAGLALPYAQRLADLSPGAGHLVHMGTHTMMRVGHYEDVALNNARALKVDAETQVGMAQTGALSQRYYLHNYLFGLSGALMAGDGPLAVKYADHAEKTFPKAAPERSRVLSRARSLVALARFDPDRALAVPEGKDDPRILAIYRHYARGEALAARRDAKGVRREAAAIAALRAQGPKAADLGGEMDVAAISEGVLLGRAAMIARKPSEAAGHFERAALAQEKAFPVPKNFDPPPWWYPVRRSLAAAYLKAGKPAEAAAAARASLAEWPHDALALRILAQADKPRGAEYRAEAGKSWQGDLAKVPLDLT